MKQPVLDSVYQFNPAFSISKRIVAYLIDGLVTLLLSLLLFLCLDPLFAKSGSVGAVNGRLSSYSKQIEQTFVEASLLQYEDGEVEDDAKVGEDFVYSLVLTSLEGEVGDISEYEGEYIYPDLDENPRSILYYYSVFKPQHAEDFDSASSGLPYLAERFGQQEKFAEFPLLKREVALLLDDLISHHDSKGEYEGEGVNAIYSSLHSAFLSCLREAREDLTEHYGPLIELYSSFEDSRASLVRIKIAELTLSFAFACLAYYFVLPLLCHGRTVSLLLLSGVCLSGAGTKARWYQLLARSVFLFFCGFANLALLILLLYGQYASYFLQVPLFGGVSFYMVDIFALLIPLCSLLLLCFDKPKRRALSDLCTYTTIKEKGVD